MILFGAGVYAKKYKALLEYLHMDFDYFTDNDSSKWGTVLYGKPIISPYEVSQFSDRKIIISSTHEAAIREQLAGMGLSECIMDLNELYTMCEKQMDSSKDNLIRIHEQDTVVVDMYEGIGWGGSKSKHRLYILQLK